MKILYYQPTSIIRVMHKEYLAKHRHDLEITYPESFDDFRLLLLESGKKFDRVRTDADMWSEENKKLLKEIQQNDPDFSLELVGTEENKASYKETYAGLNVIVYDLFNAPTWFTELEVSIYNPSLDEVPSEAAISESRR